MVKQGWLYVVELAPTGYIKVGRSESPTKRISDHIANAKFGGASVVRFASIAVDDAPEEEQRLLHHLKWLPGVVTVLGKEMFSGLTFVDALAEADRIVSTPSAPPMEMEELLMRAAQVMDDLGVTRVLLGELRDLLGLYGPSTNKELGSILKRNGVARGTVWSQRLKREGYGLKREHLPVATTKAA